MGITVIYRGRHVRFAYSLKKRQVVATFVVLLSLFFVAAKSINSSPDHQLNISHTQAGLAQQKADVETLKLVTQDKLIGLTMKLAEAQSQLHRINALSQEIVVQAGLNPTAFDFSEPMPVGGLGLDTELPEYVPSHTIVSDIDQVISQINDKQNQLKVLESIFLGHHISEQSEIAGRPVKSGWLSSFYGIRKDPFNGLPTMHKGVDFAGKEGDPVVATGAGIVVWSAERYGYGNLVEIDHGAGVRTRYAHNKSLSVKVGDVVTKQQTIAIMGSTGRSTGPHVHYEVIRNGVQQDPLRYVSRRRNN
jgi:murein DD-endopeptidase MepM/ murein hydrolase activator NlpD